MAEREAILRARGLNKSFGAVTAAADINADIERDSVVGLIGTNGAGKTTFINMITGYLTPTSGSIHFEGRDITGLAPRRVTRLGICRSFQVPQVFDALSVRENVMVALGIALRNAGHGWLGWRKKEVPGHGAPADQVADAILSRFGLGADRDKPARQLPQGVRKLLDIAIALIAKPRILLLDEPTSGVSAQEKFGIMDMVMQAVRRDAVTVLFVEHDMEIITRYSQRVLAFYDGRVIADGLPDKVLGDPEVSRYVTGRMT